MSEYVWLNDISKTFLERGYLLPGQTVDERVNAIANRAAEILGKPEFAPKFVDYMKRGWFSLSSPIWSNFGTERGLPISCFGSYVEDSMEGITQAWAEIVMMTKHGGGTSAYFGDVRPRDAAITNNGKSNGPMPFIEICERLTSVVSQGSTRRGRCAVYQHIDHPDVEEFLAIRSEGNNLQDVDSGLVVSDSFMKRLTDRDPDAMKLWAKVIVARNNTGYPYIMFEGNANRNKPACYKDMTILHSNLCSEIMLPDNSEESFVCDLSSMNILYFDDWRFTDAVEVLTYFLDAVMTEFIEKAKKIKFFDRAVNFAERHRALGIGWIGYHSYLQSKMIPFESMDAHFANVGIARTIKDRAENASRKLAEEFGEPLYCKGTGMRNTTLCAIAPTQSSSAIMGQVSGGIEPFFSNYFVADKAKVKYTKKNEKLQEVLEAKGKNTEEVWQSILMNGGSVQHLDCLDENEKGVFKTFAEISPMAIITQASARQKHIDQGQSLNLVIPQGTPAREINKLLMTAYDLGIKALYYQINENAAQNLSRSLTECVSCQG